LALGTFPFNHPHNISFGTPASFATLATGSSPMLLLSAIWNGVALPLSMATTVSCSSTRFFHVRRDDTALEILRADQPERSKKRVYRLRAFKCPARISSPTTS